MAVNRGEKASGKIAKSPAKTTKAPAKSAAKASTAPNTKPEKLGIKELLEIISSRFPLVSRSVVNQVVSETFKEISGSLQEGKVVAIKDFGKFEVRHRAARLARNPQTGEQVEVAEKTVPKFSFAKALKTSLS